VSEGGLELSPVRTHRAAAGDPNPQPELRSLLDHHQPGAIGRTRIQPRLWHAKWHAAAQQPHYTAGRRMPCNGCGGPWQAPGKEALPMPDTIPHLPERTATAASIPDGGGQAVTVTPDQAEVLASALADAIAYQTPEGFCRDCEDSRSALCGEHAGRRRAAQVTRTGRVHRMAVRKIAHPSVDDRKARGHGGRPGADTGGRTGGAAVRACAAAEHRPVRLARTAADVRCERLRRDAAPLPACGPGSSAPSPEATQRGVRRPVLPPRGR
jgi:hypothetical protein